MKIMYFTTLCQLVWKRKTRISTYAIIILLAILCALGGIKQVQKKSIERENEYAEYQTKLEAYEKTVNAYDESIKTIENNVKTLQIQYDAQEKYCDESIYMQINGNDFYEGYMQLTVLGERQLNEITASLSAFVNSAGFRELLADSIEIESNYLKEILFCTSTGNTINISVYHFDEQELREIQNAIEKILNKSIVKFDESYGSFELVENERAISKKADLTIVNSQNSVLANLKSYATQLTDTKNSIITKENEKNSYISNNKPEVVTLMSRKDKIKQECIFVLIGVALGIIILFLWDFTRTIWGKKITNIDYIFSQGISVIGDYENKKGLEEIVSKEVTRNIALFAKAKQTNEIYILDFTTDGFIDNYLTTYKNELCEDQVVLNIDDNSVDLQSKLKKVVNYHNVVVVIRFNETTYQDFSEVLDVCHRFETDLVGVVLAK